MYHDVITGKVYWIARAYNFMLDSADGPKRSYNIQFDQADGYYLRHLETLFMHSKLHYFIIQLEEMVNKKSTAKSMVSNVQCLLAYLSNVFK